MILKDLKKKFRHLVWYPMSFSGIGHGANFLVYFLALSVKEPDGTGQRDIKNVVKRGGHLACFIADKYGYLDDF